MLRFKQFIKENYQTTTINGHPMIDIDGKFYHVNDSSGRPIHSTEAGIRNFHKWFGKSKTVDEHGRPRVFYHGTSSDIPKFDLSYTGKGNDQFGSGFYLTDNPETASHYASMSGEYKHIGDSSKAPNVIPTYVSVKKPIDKDSEKPLSLGHLYTLITQSPNHKEGLEEWGDVSREGYHKVLRKVLDAYKDMPAYHAMNNIGNDFYPNHPIEFLNNFKKITKYDGVISDKDNVITAFTPNQIKSSIGNTGRFRKRKNEITESVSDDPLKWKYKNDDVNTIKKTGKNLGSFNHSFKTYTMFKDPSPSYNKDGYGFIHVIDDEDNVVGDIFWGRREEDGKQEAAVEVHPKHRRRKIATHLYNKVEELTGEKLHPAPDHTKDAAAFWANRINSSK